MRFFRSLLNQPYLLLSLTSLFWAGNSVVGRAIVEDIPPAALSLLRWVLAFLLVLPFAWPQLKHDLPTLRRRLPMLVLLAFTGISVFNTCLYWSLHYTTAINATLMQSSAPLLIGLWSFVLFREPLTRGQIAGVFVSLAGVATIVSGGDPNRLAELALNIGDVIVVLATAVYALYSALLRRRPTIGPLSLVTVTMALGAVMLVPFAILEFVLGARFAPVTAASLAALAYVAIFPSVLAYIFFNRGVQLIGANRAGPFFHLVPLFGAVLAVVFLGERPAVYHGFGALLIIGGVVLASRRSESAVGNRVATEPRRP